MPSQYATATLHSRLASKVYLKTLSSKKNRSPSWVSILFTIEQDSFEQDNFGFMPASLIALGHFL